MLHKVISTYKELAKLVPALARMTSSSARNKQQLLKMARDGMPKPRRKNPLGTALSNYTCKAGSYDPVFDKKIRRLAPQWFASPAEAKRKLLLEMARQGKQKPHRGTPLSEALKNYIKNPSFSKEIRRIAPHWFVSQSKVAKEKKKQLIEVARNKMPRPRQTTKLGKALCHATQKTSSTYDPVFNGQIRRLAPQWFVSSADANKKTLLEMARKKLLKPTTKNKIGKVLFNYTSKKSNSYDPVFAKKIRKLAPHWFKKPT